MIQATAREYRPGDKARMRQLVRLAYFESFIRTGEPPLAVAVPPLWLPAVERWSLICLLPGRVLTTPGPDEQAIYTVYEDGTEMRHPVKARQSAGVMHGTQVRKRVRVHSFDDTQPSEPQPCARRARQKKKDTSNDS